MQLVSESVKTKHAYNTHLSEKQVMEKQLQNVNASVETLKARIAHSEEQVREAFSCLVIVTLPKQLFSLSFY